MKITNILVPVDFSETSREAMQYASRLALAFHARLVAAHIVPSFAAVLYALPGDPCAIEQQVLVDAEKKLAGEIPEVHRTRVDSWSIVRGGDVRDELLRLVESEKIDLIVMGTHGRRARERFFLGSTTDNLLRSVPVPVLTVSPRSEEITKSPAESPFQRIVYATDLSETAVDGFRYCVDLARTLGAQLTILHILDVKASVAFESNPEAREHLEARMHKMIESENCIGLPPRIEVGHGTPYLRISNFSEKTNADLLVINLQARDAIERALLGSTAERVIRSSRIPVLSIPSSAVRNTLRGSNLGVEESLQPSESRTA